MVDVDNLPAWARRRLDRHFKRGGSGRILRWMTLPAGAPAVPAAGAANAAGHVPADNVIVFARASHPIPAASACTLAAS